MPCSAEMSSWVRLQHKHTHTRTHTGYAYKPANTCTLLSVLGFPIMRPKHWHSSVQISFSKSLLSFDIFNRDLAPHDDDTSIRSHHTEWRRAQVCMQTLILVCMHARARAHKNTHEHMSLASLSRTILTHYYSNQMLQHNNNQKHVI